MEYEVDIDMRVYGMRLDGHRYVLNDNRVRDHEMARVARKRARAEGRSLVEEEVQPGCQDCNFPGYPCGCCWGCGSPRCCCGYMDDGPDWDVLFDSPNAIYLDAPLRVSIAKLIIARVEARGEARKGT